MAQALREAREKVGLSRDKLATLAGTSRQQIERLEKGERELTKQWAERLAPHLRVSAVELLFPKVVAKQSDTVQNIPVEGEAAAGVWRQMFDAQERKYPPVPASPEPRYAAFRQFSVKIIGESMNKVLPNESFAICVPFWEVRRTPLENDLVYVQRSEGGQYENTVKRVHIAPGGVGLWPESTHPRFQDPIAFASGGEVMTVELVGLVIGKYEPL